MHHGQEEIEIEIDSALLEKISAIAGKQGLSPEQCISRIISQYIEKQELLFPQS